MRDLKVVELDADGKHILCEDADSTEKFTLPVDDRLRAAMDGEPIPPEQSTLDIDLANLLSPKEIQARIRAGATVEQVAATSGSSIDRVQRFANPVLLERFRAAELAAAAHPVLTDGPAVSTLRDIVTAALHARGLGADRLSWDAWRDPDNRWTVQMGWQAGRSDNLAHFRFTPGSHGGTVTALDDAASELIDPAFKPRQLAPVARLTSDPTAQPVPSTAPAPAPGATVEAADPHPENRRGKPVVPAWEEVLLGVRSSGQR
ncbi:septation protein SepH [Mycobacterium sp.]|uniref:septation protein SepH n=1 Tax=Mycobacterium sp. TaxID=1785 RepID=UPI003A8B3C46